MTGRVVVGALGVAGIGAGIVQVLFSAGQASPAKLVALFAVVVIVEDAVLIPMSLGIGWVVQRVVPARARRVVQFVLVALSGVVLLGGALALSQHRGGTAVTALTQPYGRNVALLVALAVVAGVVAVLVTGQARSPRSRTRSE